MNIHDAKLDLIKNIISMYHTTRISDTPYQNHIVGKRIVEKSFEDLFAAYENQLTK